MTTSFPYKREFINPEELWQNCCTLDLAELKVLNIPNIDTDRLPGWRSIPRNIKWKFQGKTVAFVVSKAAYEKVNRLVDYFSEEARMNAKRKGHPSPWEFYQKNRESVEVKARELQASDTENKLFTHWLREAIYFMVPECTTFKISVTKAFFKYVQSKVVLDPSAGWGDRLLGAAAAGVEVYHGIDPNQNLRSCYDEMIQFVTLRNPKLRYHVQIDDFLKVEIKPESYDTVFTSPPYYDYEIYSEDIKQSIQGRPTLARWMNDFFYPYLKKAWNALVKGGYFAIYINDTKNNKYVLDMYQFINETLHGNYLGIIGITDDKMEYGYPIWIWRK